MRSVHPGGRTGFTVWYHFSTIAYAQGVILKHGISDQTCDHWRRKYRGRKASQVGRINKPGEENRKLKQLAGEQALVIKTLKEFQKKRWA